MLLHLPVGIRPTRSLIKVLSTAMRTALALIFLGLIVAFAVVPLFGCTKIDPLNFLSSVIPNIAEVVPRLHLDYLQHLLNYS